MKYISIVIVTVTICLLLQKKSVAQNSEAIAPNSIDPHHITIGYNKTSNIIFPFAIKSVDRGSQNVLAQKAKGVENILQIKAGKEDFEETNLTVITADGKLYSFLLNYAAEPSVLNFSFGTPSVTTNNHTIFSPDGYNEAETQSYAATAFSDKRQVRGIKDKKYDIKCSLNGLAIHDNQMYCRIKIENRSHINYDIDQLRFFIRDQKKVKRTAIQEIEIKPLYVYNDTATIVGKTEYSMVFALPKFTIPDKKYLAIQLMEKNGGRHLELRVNNKNIINATVLPTE